MSTPPVPDDEPHGGTPPGGEHGPVRWGGLVRVLSAIRRVVNAVLATLCIILFVWLVVVVAWQVFTRQVLHNSAPWTSEAATYSLVLLAIMAIAYVYSERGHIAVEMFVQKLPERGQTIMGLVIELIVIFFTVFVFIIGGARVAESTWHQKMAILPFSVGEVYVVLPLAGVLIVFYSIAHIIGILSGAEKAMPEFDENAEAI
ncbi:TRAP transporter small permease [Microbacterium protaetiae]|nr:TRAP transporter small permease [Microbacterium protaetiae]